MNQKKSINQKKTFFAIQSSNQLFSFQNLNPEKINGRK